MGEILEKISRALWGVPLTGLVLFAGVKLTFATGFVQFRGFKKAFSGLFSGKKGVGVSPFAALCTSLSATIGTGNIVGVTAAVVGGGAGALFWMLVCATLGMAVKFSEGFFAVRYRKTDSFSPPFGGPFLYMERGLAERFPRLKRLPRAVGLFFAAVCVFGSVVGLGTLVQANGMALCIRGISSSFGLTEKMRFFGSSVPLSVAVFAVVSTFAAAVIIFGGLKSVSAFSTVAVPVMAGVYVLLSLCVVFCNLSALPDALRRIFVGAFNPSAAVGGAVGYGVSQTVRLGVSRGIFSNESGVGTAPIAIACSDGKDPREQGLVAMLGTFFDTHVLCLLTGLAVLVTGADLPLSDGTARPEAADLVTEAFTKGLSPVFGESSEFGRIVLCVCLILFAFTTVVGWCFYGEQSLRYICGKSRRFGLFLTLYRLFYIAFVFLGAFVSVRAAWNAADICNALMALPNTLTLLVLARRGFAESRTRSSFSFRERRKKPFRR